MPPWRIVFMGTPDFAVPSLKALLEGPDRVVAVVAQPDRPAGRGQKVQVPPTIQLAQARGIPTLQAQRVRTPAFRMALEAFSADLFVVVAYGRILTPEVLAIPPRGCVNVHASLLPRYRGAAPIQWALLRGEKVTGITTMRMDAGLDTGDMLLRREVEIPPTFHAGQLHDLLSGRGAEVLLETVAGLKAERLEPQPQPHALATLAPPLKKEDGLVDWSRPAEEIGWQVRGLTPWPGAYTYLCGKRLVLLEGLPLAESGEADTVRAHPGVPGSIRRADAEGLEVVTGCGTYRITVLKPENGRGMTVAAYLHGHPVAPGGRLAPAPDSDGPGGESS